MTTGTIWMDMSIISHYLRIYFISYERIQVDDGLGQAKMYLYTLIDIRLLELGPAWSGLRMSSNCGSATRKRSRAD